MKKLNILICVFTLLLIANGAFAEDLSGKWLADVTSAETQCEDLGWDPVGNYTIEIFKGEKSIIIVPQRPHVRYVGKFLTDMPNKAHLRATYMKDGGYLTEIVDITFENSQSATGKTLWQWSDGVFACGGSYSFVLKRQ